MQMYQSCRQIGQLLSLFGLFVQTTSATGNNSLPVWDEEAIVYFEGYLNSCTHTLIIGNRLSPIA